MSRARSIYVLIKTGVIVICTFFRNFYYFGMKTWVKKANNFPIAIFEPQGVA